MRGLEGKTALATGGSSGIGQAIAIRLGQEGMNVENLRLAELADEHVGEFMFVVSHAKLRGATGAWVAPLAIV